MKPLTVCPGRRTSPALMTLLILFLWCLVFAISWPLAILALILFPILWLAALPFRLVYWAVEAALALAKAILFLPARLLGHKARA